MSGQDSRGATAPGRYPTKVKEARTVLRGSVRAESAVGRKEVNGHPLRGMVGDAERGESNGRTVRRVSCVCALFRLSERSLPVILPNS